MKNMKPSGIQWIGDIPSEWKLAVLGRYVTQVKNKNTDLSESNLLSLSYGKIKRKDINTNDGLLPASFDGYNIIEEGDIVLRLTDLQNDHTSLRVGRATERGIITSAYVTIRPEKYISSEYLYYVLHSFDIVKGFYGMGAGIRQGLTYDGVQSLKIPSPDMSEQKKIVQYLDDRCSKIDEIIAEATASIEEYKELKQAVIFEAVTKGIEDTEETKKTEIFWVPMIPVRWDIVKVARSYSVELGKMLDAKRVSGERLKPYLRNSDVQWYGINIESLNEMDFSEEEDERYSVKTGDLLVCEGGDIGKSCIVPEGFPEGIYYQKALHRVRSYDNDINSLKWLRYVLYVMSKYGYFNAFSGEKATIQHLPAVTFNQLKFPMPKKDERNRIIEYLERKIPEYDALISEKQALIEDLQAYKKSLIYEVVTGKRRVV